MGSADLLNGVASRWVELAWTVVWQSTLLAAIMALIVLAFRRSSPEVRYWLWQIVAIKLLLMPFWTVGVPVWTDSDERPAARAGIPQGESVVSDLVPEDVEPERAAIDWTDQSPAEPQEQTMVPGRSRLGGSLALPGTVTSVDIPERPHVPEPTPSRREARPVPSSSRSAIALAAQIRWQGWLVLVWLTIVAAQAAGMLVQRIRLGRLLSSASAAEPQLAALVADMATMLGLSRVPRTVLINRNGSPFVCGVLRPVVAMPAAIGEALTAGQLRQVVLHELAHVKRRDLLWGWIPEIVRALYFFHPVAHWACSRIRLERELACDRIAMAASGAEAGEYAETLVRAVGFSSRPVVLQTGAVHCGCSSQLKSFWKRRIAMLPVTRRCRAPRFESWLSVAITGIVIAIVPTLLTVSATAQPTAPSSSEREAPETPPNKDDTSGTEPPRSTPDRVERLLEIGEPSEPAERRVRSWDELAQGRKAAPGGTRVEMMPAIGASGSGPFMDIITLANGYMEALGRIRTAEIELQRQEYLLRKAATVEIDVARVRADLENAKMKADLSRRILLIARRFTETELDIANERVELFESFENPSLDQDEQLAEWRWRYQQARGRLEILDAILSTAQTRDGDEKDGGPGKR